MAKAKVNGVLRLLLREVLEQIPEAEAQKLVEGYRQEKNIVLVIGSSSLGNGRKTAFGWKLSADQKWRGFPKTGRVH